MGRCECVQGRIYSSRVIQALDLQTSGAHLEIMERLQPVPERGHLESMQHLDLSESMATARTKRDLDCLLTIGMAAFQAQQEIAREDLLRTHMLRIHQPWWWDRQWTPHQPWWWDRQCEAATLVAEQTIYGKLIYNIYNGYIWEPIYKYIWEAYIYIYIYIYRPAQYNCLETFR